MRPRVPASVVLAAVLLGGCAQSVDPIERLGKKAAQRVRHTPSASQPYRRWGLDTPLRPAPRSAPSPTPSPSLPPVPARPAPRTAGPGLAPVLDHVHTTDKVVFLTYDDGAQKDLRLIEMVRELRLPVSVFLTDGALGPGHGHFSRLQSVGATVQNHTLGHPSLRDLPYAGQRAEICGRQRRLRSRFGHRPRLLRPPYGTYGTVTRRAAAACGVSAIVLWRAAMGPAGLAYTHGVHRLRPGDIVAVGPDEPAGTPLPERTARLLRRVQREGLTVGRLEDYL
ncbi:polysaccharide deacetylase family protein [Streptomyces sp. NPDC005423]|uniref:polysaccharide deacetylase family protein n=1 Tax=Streptomyces sp. NPDC005423 TaxID=3155343 RepID=UPI0033BC44E2